MPPSKLVAVFADPVFSSDDPRVHHLSHISTTELTQNSAANTADVNADIERSGRESGMLALDRLRSSRTEAKGILEFAPKVQVLEALDFQASRDTAIGPDLAMFRIVHFASHALLNVQHPELSGVVLSLVDQEGKPKNGFLRLQDIYNLKLGAGLVVLSACRTALGKEVKGEGLLSLTRAFMYAGAPRVVASLWRVPDKATAELMKEFYRGMLLNGLRPAAALRAAQMTIRQQRTWADPYYWAAFILEGEWQ
jgi:CHAT domain-containing protein